MRPDDLPHGPRRLQVNLPSGALTLWVPEGTDALLETLAEAPPDPDDKMPYWADLWPSAVALASAIDAGVVPVEDRTVLEIGAGLGLASLAAARAGAANVRATDWDQDALRYVRASADLNRVNVATGFLDWRRPDPRDRAQLVLAADVLYEARNVPAVVATLTALVCEGGEAWLADPGRSHLPNFVRQATAFSFGYVEWTARVPRGQTAKIQLLRLRRGKR